MEKIFGWVQLVEGISEYLLGSDDAEVLIEMYESMYPGVSVTYEGDSLFKVDDES